FKLARPHLDLPPERRSPTRRGHYRFQRAGSETGAPLRGGLGSFGNTLQTPANPLRHTNPLLPRHGPPMLSPVALVVILLVVGVALLLLETMLPGLVAGIIGCCCLVAGIALSYARLDAGSANLILVLVLVLLVGGFALWLKFFPGSRLGKRFVSHRVVGNIDAEKP